MRSKVVQLGRLTSHSRIDSHFRLATRRRGSREFPPCGTVYHYFRAWQNSGLWVHLHRVFYEQVRRHAGREACPSVVVIVPRLAGIGVAVARRWAIHNVPNKRQVLFSPYTVVTKYKHTIYCVLQYRRHLLILTLIWTNMLSGETEPAKVRKKSKAPQGSM
jgi:hypothetical protein